MRSAAGLAKEVATVGPLHLVEPAAITDRAPLLDHRLDRGKPLDRNNRRRIYHIDRPFLPVFRKPFIETGINSTIKVAENTQQGRSRRRCRHHQPNPFLVHNILL
jgi:hypothetical protein